MLTIHSTCVQIYCTYIYIQLNLCVGVCAHKDRISWIRCPLSRDPPVVRREPPKPDQLYTNLPYPETPTLLEWVKKRVQLVAK